MDTICDPDPVDFPIPGNDDALWRAPLTLYCDMVADAVLDGIILTARPRWAWIGVPPQGAPAVEPALRRAAPAEEPVLPCEAAAERSPRKEPGC